MAEKTTNRVDGAAMERDTKATLTGHAADMTIVYFFHDIRPGEGE